MQVSNLPTVVLASASPRRRDLLLAILPEGSFLVDPADIDECLYEQADPVASALSIARAKADVAIVRHPEATVITADTVVFVGAEHFGKPETPEEAVRMLLALSGRSHNVVTAYTVRRAGKWVERAVVTEVAFRPISLAQAETYVRTGESLDKAGAYAIQGGAGVFVDEVRGSISNVIGLPVDELRLDLRRFGY